MRGHIAAHLRSGGGGMIHIAAAVAKLIIEISAIGVRDIVVP